MQTNREPDNGKYPTRSVLFPLSVHLPQVTPVDDVRSAEIAFVSRGLSASSSMHPRAPSPTPISLQRAVPPPSRPHTFRSVGVLVVCSHLRRFLPILLLPLCPSCSYLYTPTLDYLAYRAYANAYSGVGARVVITGPGRNSENDLSRKTPEKFIRAIKKSPRAATLCFPHGKAAGARKITSRIKVAASHALRTGWPAESTVILCVDTGEQISYLIEQSWCNGDIRSICLIDGKVRQGVG